MKEIMIERIMNGLSKIGDKMIDWVDHIVLMLPNFLVAMLIVLIGVICAKYGKKWGKQGFVKVTKNDTMGNLIGNFIFVLILMFTLFVALNVLNLDKTVTSLLAGAGVVGLAIGLAFQDPILNLFSGVSMSMRHTFNIGDLVRTSDVYGTVAEMHLNYTVIRKLDGQLVSIPNKSLIQNPLENVSTRARRIRVDVGVAYDSDLDLVQKVALEAIKKNIKTNRQKPTQFFYTEFADSSINFVLFFWIRNTDEPSFNRERSKAIIAIKKAFDANDINIPFPIRTLYMHKDD